MTAWHEKAKSLLKASGMSIRELSDKLDLTPGAVGHYLSGRRHPRPGMLINIARELHVSVSELIEDDPTFARNPIEREALDLVRRLPDDRQNAALAMLRGLSEEPDHPPPD